MAEYQTIVVGTDGSDTSLRAVDEAARIASESNARLVVVTAYPADEARGRGGPDPDQDRGEGYRTEGNSPVYDRLRDASARARSAGVTSVEERAVEGSAVEALLDVSDQTGADLIVVGSVGMNTLAGRLIGSVPHIVKRKAKAEVLVVDTRA